MKLVKEITEKILYLPNDESEEENDEIQVDNALLLQNSLTERKANAIKSKQQAFYISETVL